jgi:RNA polymerase sigma-70 factor (ECF subfamily)
VQDVYVRLVATIGTFDTSKNFWPWLQTVARHICYDALRQQQRHSRTESIVAQFEPLVSRDHAEQTVDQQTSRSRLASALRKVPQRYRRAVYLQAVQDWSYEELAIDDGSSVSSMAKVLARAKDRIRTALEEGRTAWVALWGRAKGLLSRARELAGAERAQPLLQMTGQEAFALIIGFGCFAGLFGSVGTPLVDAHAPANRAPRAIAAPASARAPAADNTVAAPGRKHLNPRRDVRATTGPAHVDVWTDEGNGANSSGARQGMSVRDANGNQLIGAEQGFECTHPGEVTPRGLPYSVTC